MEKEKSRSTIWREKQRGYETGRNYQRGTLKDKELKRIIEILNLDSLNLAGLVSLKTYKLSDVKYRKSNLTQDEFIAFKSEITRLRNDLRKFIQFPSQRLLVGFQESTKVHHYVLFGKIVMDKAKRSDCIVRDEELEECKIAASKFYNELKF